MSANRTHTEIVPPFDTRGHNENIETSNKYNTYVHYIIPIKYYFNHIPEPIINCLSQASSITLFETIVHCILQYKANLMIVN